MSDEAGNTNGGLHWQQVDRCFDELLDAPDGEREAVLAALAQCYGQSVVAEACELINSLEATHSIFAQPAPIQVDVLGADEHSPPEKVGRWHLRERLGSGGQGQVYVATKQAEQFEQTGALKILSDRFSAGAIQRFLRERQTLARLRHPNIAVLLDAGASEDGRPYLVSELIRGVTFDQYIDSRQRSVVERVKLLLPVVEAVAYAHQQFVLHRDIKPANVIVNEDHVPYLLDFGVSAAIADAAGAAAGSEPPAPYTPSYAAPEQMTNGPLDVRTDCWALGALLYRALAGRRPFAAQRVDQTIHAVLHETPAPPSRDDELNAIVAKCLKKTLEDRYADVGQLRDDLQAWLNDAPVSAAANSRWYSARKWLKRHRLLTASVSLVAMSLIGGAGVSTFQAQRAAEQRDFAEAAAQRYQTAVGLLVDVFNGANPALRRGRAPSAEDLLEETYSRVTGMDEPSGVKAALAHELAAVFLNRGEAAKAARLSANAVDHFESTRQTASETYANSLVSLGTAEKMLGRYDESAAMLERSLRVQREHLWSASDWRYAYTQNMLGSLQTLMGRHDRAVAIFRSAMDSLNRSAEAPDWLKGTVFRNYWRGKFRLGQGAEARRAFAGWIDDQPADAPEEPVAYVHASLGEIALFDARYREAQDAYTLAARLLSGIYGPAHRDVALYRERASYAEVLTSGELTSVEQAGSLRLPKPALEGTPGTTQTRLTALNHRLSLTPYVNGDSRPAWVQELAEQQPSEPGSDRLAWHQHLLLRALSARLVGREQEATDALAEAATAALYDSKQAQWQREAQQRLAAWIGESDSGRCRALRAALAQPFSLELAIAARGLSSDECIPPPL